MKYYKSVQFLLDLNVKPPCTNNKPLCTNIKTPCWWLSGNGSAWAMCTSYKTQ